MSNDLIQVLEELKKLGKITDEDIRAVTWASEKKRQVIDTLHLLLCRRNHDDDCTYMQESILVENECWASPAHKEWIEKADSICAQLGVKDRPDKAIELIEQAIDITRTFTERAIYLALSALHPELLEYLPLDFSADKLLPAPSGETGFALLPDPEGEFVQQETDDDSEGLE